VPQKYKKDAEAGFKEHGKKSLKKKGREGERKKRNPHKRTVKKGY